MPLDHVDEWAVLLRLAVVDDRHTRSQVNYAPGPFQLREGAEIAPSLPTNKRLVNRHSAANLEIRLNLLLYIARKGISYHSKVGLSDAISRYLLRYCICGPLDPHYYRSIESCDVHAGQRRSIVDMLLSITKTADPEIVVLRFI